MSTLDPERWRAASAELDRALELPGAARAGFLADLRARDAVLAADVEGLLIEHRALDAERFLEHAPAGLSAETDDVTRSSNARLSGRSSGVALASGTIFGPYRIVRTLGRGGMGTVYEADEIESGRRVALKVLEERLDDDRERDRFAREGRLAASINHPNCVFVFGASEIDGRPAIAMELMQGTLADRVKAQGPVPASAAVDIVLGLLSGLEAASAIGILHRDIKPSNCFVDGAVVKIGDFGTSRSLRPTEETALSTRTKFAATPAYASPEQLRGSTLVPAVPKGLSQVVLRCLAKQPHQRYADYAALAAALEPYSSAAASPAMFGRRFLAGIIDHLLIMPVGLASNLWWGGTVFGSLERDVRWWQLGTGYVAVLLYFGISESVWARTPGKALVRLALADRSAKPAKPVQVFVRAGMYNAIWFIGPLLWVVLGPADVGARIQQASRPGSMFLTSILSWLLLAAVFSSARRRNGFAGWHDLASRTRLVEYSVRGQSPARSATLAPSTAPPGAVARLGPFQVLDRTAFAVPAGWLPGFDDRLGRGVWIRSAPAGTPPLDAARLAVNRATRLRWLAGRRNADEAWDVFEAVPGISLERACAQPHPWVDVRWWLLDLACECAAQAPDDRASRRADRVWILDAGGAKLTDDPAGDRVDGVRPEPSALCALLVDVARAARGSDPEPWPLGAQRFLDTIGSASPPDENAIVQALEPLTRQRGVLTRGWRALSILALPAGPVIFSAFMLAIMGLALRQFERMPADARIALEALQRIHNAEAGRIRLSPPDRQALEHALATRYRPAVSDFKRVPLAHFPWVLPPDYVPIAERVLRRQPTEAESRQAGTPRFRRWSRRRRSRSTCRTCG
jgi:hypothetical protein